MAIHISIHALLAESDLLGRDDDMTQLEFLSTLSLRRATMAGRKRLWRIVYFYPRSPCGERPRVSSSGSILIRISIHALLAESDRAAMLVSGPRSQFLSTLSLRRATTQVPKNGFGPVNFYPRSPCGERLIAWSPDRPVRAFLSTLSLRRATWQL